MKAMDTATTGSDFDVLLSDGSTAHVRDIAPSDAEALRQFHASLSTRSIVMRYFSPHPTLSDKEIERFTNVDCIDRVALVVNRGGCIVAVARYDRSPGSDEAEVAFVVQDEFQGLGLGTILLEHLATIARRHGIRRFTADTLSENRRMLGVFRDAGFARRYSRASEVVQVVLDITPSAAALAAAAEHGIEVIDIRTAAEVAARPAGARHIPMQDLLANPGLLSVGRQALLVCATGKRSRAAALALRERGLAVRSLAGGLQNMER